MNNKKKNKISFIIIVILIIIIILLLLTFFGYVKNYNIGKPTGNVDVFSIDCNCIFDDNTSIPVFGENNKGILIYKSSLNIFTNPAFGMRNIIAPESTNVYDFIIFNNNPQDIEYSFDVEERNEYNVNMKYRLKLNGEYIIGNDKEWVRAGELMRDFETLVKAGSDKYSLEWKWFSASNDTSIGEIDDASYGLDISISFRYDN